MNQPASLSSASIRGELCRRSLHYFVKTFWSVIEPEHEFVDGPHIRAMCLHLEAVWRGDIKNLIMNVPPRHMKSGLTSVFWPAWIWAQRPTIQFLTASYAMDLSTRDNVKMRRLIESEQYKSLMLDTLPQNDKRRFQLTGDQNSKIKFENNRNGSRQATSVESQVAGHNADIVVVDDPHNTTEYQSEANLEQVATWWSSGMSNRMNDPKKLKRVLIMQRVSGKDLTARLIKQGGWELLCLPAEFEPARKTRTKIGFEDWRTEPGQLLWPERFGADELDSLKAGFDWDKYKISSQLQQNPTPSEGGIFKEEYFIPWGESPLPDFEAIIQSWDTALESKQESDYSVCTTWGIFQKKFVLGEEHGRRKGMEEWRYCMMLLEVFEKRLEGPELRESAIEQYNLRKPDYVLVERKASGHNLIHEMKRAGIPVLPFDPKGRDKVARAQIAAIVFQQGCVFVPPRKWVTRAVEQCLHFPKGENDDIVDSIVQAALFLRKRFWVQYAGEADDAEVAPDPSVSFY